MHSGAPNGKDNAASLDTRKTLTESAAKPECFFEGKLPLIVLPDISPG